MERLLTAITLQLPSSLTSQGVARQTSYFGRFSERLISSTDEQLVEEDFFIESIRDCIRQLRENDQELSDPHSNLLRGLVNTIAFIASLHPEHIASYASAQREEWSDILGGRVGLLARSKLTGNILAYSTAMRFMALAGGGEASESENIALLMGSYIQKMVTGSKSCVIVEGLKLAGCFMNDAIMSLVMESIIKLVTLSGGDPSVRCNAWMLIRRISESLSDKHQTALMQAFLNEKNLDVIHSALPVVSDNSSKVPLTGYFRDLIHFLVHQDLWLKHPILFCKLIGVKVEGSVWSREMLECLVGKSDDSLACLAIWRTIRDAKGVDDSSLSPIYWVKLLERWLSSKEPNVRYGALALGRRLISQLGEAALGLQLPLTSLLDDDDPVLRHQVLQTFFTLATEDNWEKICQLALERATRPVARPDEHWRNVKLLRQVVLCISEKKVDDDKKSEYLGIILKKLPDWTVKEEYSSVLMPLKDQLRRLDDAKYLRLKVLLEIDEAPKVGSDQRCGDIELRRQYLRDESSPNFVTDKDWFLRQYDLDPLRAYSGGSREPAISPSEEYHQDASLSMMVGTPSTSLSRSGSGSSAGRSTLPIPIELMEDIFAGLSPREPLPANE